MVSLAMLPIAHITYCPEIGRLVNNDFRNMCKEKSWVNLKYYPDIYLERQRKPTKNFSLDSRSPDLEMNPGSAESEEEEEEGEEYLNDNQSMATFGDIFVCVA
jgi:hypothetical protein